jgi:hypothetical protein
MTITVSNTATGVTGDVTIPDGTSIRPSGSKWKATGPAGFSSFFADLTEAEHYANGRPARHDAWTGAVYGR